MRLRQRIAGLRTPTLVMLCLGALLGSPSYADQAEDARIVRQKIKTLARKTEEVPKKEISDIVTESIKLYTNCADGKVSANPCESRFFGQAELILCRKPSSSPLKWRDEKLRARFIREYGDHYLGLEGTPEFEKLTKDGRRRYEKIKRCIPEDVKREFAISHQQRYKIPMENLPSIEDAVTSNDITKALKITDDTMDLYGYAFFDPDSLIAATGKSVDELYRESIRFEAIRDGKCGPITERKKRQASLESLKAMYAKNGETFEISPEDIQILGTRIDHMFMSYSVAESEKNNIPMFLADMSTAIISDISEVPFGMASSKAPCYKERTSALSLWSEESKATLREPLKAKLRVYLMETPADKLRPRQWEMLACVHGYVHGDDQLRADAARSQYFQGRPEALEKAMAKVSSLRE